MNWLKRNWLIIVGIFLLGILPIAIAIFIQINFPSSPEAQCEVANNPMLNNPGGLFRLAIGALLFTVYNALGAIGAFFICILPMILVALGVGYGLLRITR